MTKKLWFQTGVAILLTLVIIRMFMEVKSIFSPLLIIGQTIFLPLLLGGVLFYLSRPLLKWLESVKFPRWASILSVFAVIGLIGWLFYALIGPPLTEQVNKLVKNTPEIVEDVEQFTKYALSQKDLLPETLQDTVDDATGKINDIAVSAGSLLFKFIQGVFQGIFVLVLVPFFLVYMLKDHEKFAPFVSSFAKGEKKTWIRKTLADIDDTLRSYIQGQLFVSFLVGLMLLIGYFAIGLEYALLLAIFGMMMNVIPFLGPYISVIPAIIIALTQEPKLAIYVAIIMLVAQQIESNFITPNVMGKSLDIHPLTVITVILAAGNIAGLWGIILAIPTYAVIKVILKNIYANRVGIKDAATKSV
ncbi:Predicted PurR-regulated permease PerM [Psychrobacillus psychrotolerans]|uniref:Predicted PurR-regulated permease PerM n=1 Tax=Psychrobacillus psychrotolerans TaxID=126156 RepID=A0A1I5Y6Z7_9BACI|nr:AI-2E family transporter [Psychrobacillus psychrotolerans]SFQ39968.1 Predicted PurR-regulated permease PerM [Psychrobacillus psychrotolerans]